MKLSAYYLDEIAVNYNIKYQVNFETENLIKCLG